MGVAQLQKYGLFTLLPTFFPVSFPIGHPGLPHVRVGRVGWLCGGEGGGAACAAGRPGYSAGVQGVGGAAGRPLSPRRYGYRMRPHWHTHAAALALACGRVGTCMRVRSPSGLGLDGRGWGYKRKMSGLPAAHLASCPRVLSVTVALPSVMVASCGCACRVWLLRLQAAVFPVPGQSCKH